MRERDRRVALWRRVVGAAGVRFNIDELGVIGVEYNVVKDLCECGPHPGPTDDIRRYQALFGRCGCGRRGGSNGKVRYVARRHCFTPFPTIGALCASRPIASALAGNTCGARIPPAVLSRDQSPRCPPCICSASAPVAAAAHAARRADRCRMSSLNWWSTFRATDGITAENGLSAVSELKGAEADAEAVRAAYREAVRVVLTSRTGVAPSPGREPPPLPELFEQHSDEILPFSLPQHRADPGANELSDELSAALPADASRQEQERHAAIARARQRLRVVTSAVQIDIDPPFNVQSGRMRVGLPPNTVVRFAGNIPAAMHHGLGSVAAQLHGAPLAENTTVMLSLDLSRYGGGYKSYRFTRLDLGRGVGTEILAERQGTVGVEGLRNDERQDLRARFDGLGFDPGAGFDTDEFDQVLIGLSQIPEPQMTVLRGLHFERGGVDPASPRVAANYDQTAHTITVFDPAFSGGQARLGTGAWPLTFAVAAVVHEVGHAIDLGVLRTSAAATEAAQQALLAEFGTGGGHYRIPGRRHPDHARFDDLNAAVTAARRAETAPRSRSGARWQGGGVTDVLARRARQPAFRQAAIDDGARPDDRSSRPPIPTWIRSARSISPRPSCCFRPPPPAAADAAERVRVHAA
jgi:hypothetical protein